MIMIRRRLLWALALIRESDRVGHLIEDKVKAAHEGIAQDRHILIA